MRHVLVIAFCVCSGIQYFASTQTSASARVASVNRGEMTPPPEEVPLNLCRYECVGNTWTLAVGNPAEGYSCAPTRGECTTGDDPIDFPAVPNLEQTTAAASSLKEGVATYQFLPSSNEFRFVRGKASSGHAFCPTISMDLLVTLYPEVAATVLSDSATLASSFTVELSSCPIDQLAKVMR